MLHYFGVFERLGFDFVDGRQVDLVSGEGREYAGKGNDKAAHIAIISPLFSSVAATAFSTARPDKGRAFSGRASRISVGRWRAGPSRAHDRIVPTSRARRLIPV